MHTPTALSSPTDSADSSACPESTEGKAGRSMEKGCPVSQGSQDIQGGCRKFSGSPKALHSYNSPLIQDYIHLPSTHTKNTAPLLGGIFSEHKSS